MFVQTYNITDPASLSGEDVAKTYAEVLKKEVKSVVVTGDQYQVRKSLEKMAEDALTM